MPDPRSVSCRLFFILVFWLAFGTTAVADPGPVYLHIPAGEAPVSLRLLSEKTGMGIMFSDAHLGKIRTCPVQGVYTPIRALEIMLEGTGLTYNATSSRTVAVTKGTDTGIPAPAAIPESKKTRPATQTGNTPVAANKTPQDVTLPPMVVTTSTGAAKARLQHVPGSASVLSGSSPVMIAATSFQDLGLWVPNAEFTNFRGYPMGFIRGVGNHVPDFYGGDSNVAYYLDGVFLENGFGADMSLFDVERVEVLRGPQGTAYGSSTAGGAVNIITCDPGDEPEFGASLSYGSYNKQRLDAVMSGPVVKDKVKARLALSHSQQDGWLNNLGAAQDAEDTDFTGIRGKATLTPTGRIEVRLKADYYETDTAGPGYKLISDQGSLSTDYGALTPSGFYEFATDANAHDETRAAGFSAAVDAHLSKDLLLQSITGYQTFKRDFAFDHDGTQLDLLVNNEFIEVTQISQQIRLKGVTGPWTWVTGLFFNAQDASADQIQNCSGIYFNLPGQTFVIQGQSHVDARTWAAFANTRFAVTDRLNLEAGLRYNRDMKTARSDPEATPGTITLSSVDGKSELDTLLPKFGIDFQLADDVLLYATTSHSSRMGYLQFSNSGFNRNPSLEPENIWSYEIGTKTQWFGHRLLANLACFYIDYDNMQIDANTGSATVSDNAPKAQIKGIELELQARPLKPLSLYATVSYLDSKFTEYDHAANLLYNSATPGVSETVSVTGNTLPFSPKWKLSFGAQYLVSLDRYGFVTLAGNVTWKDKFYFDQYQSESISQNAYAMANALIRYETGDGKWAVDLYGKNLTAEKYCTYKFMELDASNIVASMGSPRMIGVSMSYRF